ncbi:MAG: DMT family transporter [Pseudonocardiaceae bacterium]
MTPIRSSLVIVALALFWGANFLWIALALRGFTPVQLTFGRMILGAAVLLPIVVLRRDHLPRDVGTWAHLAVAGLVASSAPYLLFALAETRISSGAAGTLNVTTPLWTLALAVALRQELRPTPAQTAGFLLGFFGCLVMFSPWQGGGLDVLGGAYCLAAALSYAISYVYMRRYLTPRNLSPLTLSASQLLTATAWIAPALPFAPAPDTTAPGLLPWTALLILGLLGTGIAYVINYALIRSEGASGASVVTYLVPIVALTLGTAVAAEPLSASLVAGAALVLIGVVLSRSRSVWWAHRRRQHRICQQ